MNKNWKNVSPSHACAICGRPHETHTSCWCVYSLDGEAAICRFVESKKQLAGGGYLHRIGESRGSSCDYQSEPELLKAVNWTALNKIYQGSLNGRLGGHAEKLGLSEASLLRLGVGWDGEALTFPMFDPNGDIQGIRRRFPDGRKKAVTGGREGLFIPTGQSSHDGPIFVCEGPTDTAALLDLGLAAIGRPSCLGAEQFVIRYVGKRECVIVCDNDGPGRGGAMSLARKMPHARIIAPPEKHKDIRQWVNSETPMEEIKKILESAVIEMTGDRRR